jgi:hypothetical protein
MVIYLLKYNNRGRNANIPSLFVVCYTFSSKYASNISQPKVFSYWGQSQDTHFWGFPLNLTLGSASGPLLEDYQPINPCICAPPKPRLCHGCMIPGSRILYRVTGHILCISAFSYAIAHSQAKIEVLL